MYALIFSIYVISTLISLCVVCSVGVAVGNGSKDIIEAISGVWWLKAAAIWLFISVLAMPAIYRGI